MDSLKWRGERKEEFMLDPLNTAIESLCLLGVLINFGGVALILLYFLIRKLTR
jgi:hypothetical protein